MNKAIFTLVVLSLISISTSWALTGDEIVEKARNITDATSTMMQIVITTKDKSGTTSDMNVEQYGVDENDITKSVIEFKKPANIAGTRFLVIENPGKDEDRKIFLPELGKVRRIASSEGGGSFMGTDFSYDDISSATRETARDTHTVVGEENVGAVLCYVIESTAKKAGDSQYSKSKRWISKDKFLAQKTELFDKSGELLKVIEISSYDNIAGFMTPMNTKVTNVQEKTSTTMVVKKAIYNKAIPAGVFTEKFLKTGKP